VSTAEAEDVRRVSTLELFFDLVFVFTITQLTTVLADAPTWRGLLQAVLMLGVIWWMYGGYAWLTNAVAPDRLSRRLVLLGGMAGYLVLALAIPRAFDDAGAAFGGAYVVIVAIHATLFSRAGSVSVTQALRGLAASNFLTALLVLAGGIAGGTAQYVLWALAFVGEWVTPRLTEQEAFQVATTHFVERHGLVIIVALGESIVAVGIGAAGLPIDLELVGVAVLGLLLSACLWWTYFGGDEAEAEHALSGAPPARRPRMAVDAFGYAFLPLLLGIVAASAALKKATGHPFDELELARSLQLAGGVALFMAGDALFRAALGLGAAPWRLAAAGAAFATIPLGTQASATAQLAALVVILAGALSLEHARARAVAQARTGGSWAGAPADAGSRTTKRAPPSSPGSRRTLPP
jgi:low temperature requirement protein LtrA